MQVPLNIFAVNVQQKKVMIFLTLIFKSEIYLTVCISALRSKEDLALAQALAASEEEYRRQQQRQQVARNLSRQ